MEETFFKIKSGYIVATLNVTYRNFDQDNFYVKFDLSWFISIDVKLRHCPGRDHSIYEELSSFKIIGKELFKQIAQILDIEDYSEECSFFSKKWEGKETAVRTLFHRFVNEFNDLSNVSKWK